MRTMILPAQSFQPTFVPAAPVAERVFLSRDEAIARIRKALKARTGRTWSVTGGRGTAWGWITIDAPPARRKWAMVPTGERDQQGDEIYEYKWSPDREYGYIGHADRETLRKALGLTSVHTQGVSIPASNVYYVEYVDRAEGREPSVIGEPYWD